jgi:predicted nucleotidyltransferase
MGQTIQVGDAQMQIGEAVLAEPCQRYGVSELSCFGSAARGELRPDSDIDILVDFMPDRAIDLVDYAGLMLDLARLAGRESTSYRKRA